MGMWLHPVAHGFTASSATSCTKEVNFLGFSGDIALSGQAQAAVLLFVYAFVYLPHFFSNHTYSYCKGSGEKLGYVGFWLVIEVYSFLS